MTNEELEAIEAQGKDPLNSFEDPRDGLQALGAGVVRLAAEVRCLHAQSSRWADVADGMARALGDPTTTEHVALAERVVRERDASRVRCAETWTRVEALSAKIEAIGKELREHRAMASKAREVMSSLGGATVELHDATNTKALYALTEAILRKLGYEPEQVRWLRAFSSSEIGGLVTDADGTRWTRDAQCEAARLFMELRDAEAKAAALAEIGVGIVLERDKAREEARLWRALLAARVAYHKNSGTEEWRAYEMARENLRAAGHDPDAP